jgi:hypothetical protein
MSASVKSSHSGPAPGADLRFISATPWANAQTFPDQPGGVGGAVMTTSRSAAPVSRATERATSAVPSVDPSSTRITLSEAIS